MSDEGPDEPTEGTQPPPEPEPAPEPAYPSLELTELSESDRGGRGGWRSLDDE
jgi:hypothetical protein